MATVVQQSAVGKFTGSLNATCTLNGVTAGNSLFVLVSHANGDGSPTTSLTFVYDGTIVVGNRLSFDKRVTANANRAAEIHRKHGATSGTHTFTAVAQG